jgi:hypothetical protein
LSFVNDLGTLSVPVAQAVCSYKTLSRLVARGVLLFTEQIRFVRAVRMIRNKAVALGRVTEAEWGLNGQFPEFREEPNSGCIAK